MTTNTPKVEYEKETCGRCGGSGRYSWNQVDRDRCYGCSGTGKRLTKRGRAALEFADGILNMPIEAYADHAAGQVAIYRDALTGQRHVFDGTIEGKPMKGRFMRDNVWHDTETRSFTLTRGDTSKDIGLGGGIKVRLIPTEDQIDQINAYQDSLTKAGKPRKRRG